MRGVCAARAFKAAPAGIIPVHCLLLLLWLWLWLLRHSSKAAAAAAAPPLVTVGCIRSLLLLLLLGCSEAGPSTLVPCSGWWWLLLLWLWLLLCRFRCAGASRPSNSSGSRGHGPASCGRKAAVVGLTGLMCCAPALCCTLPMRGSLLGCIACQLGPACWAMSCMGMRRCMVVRVVVAGSMAAATCSPTSLLGCFDLLLLLLACDVLPHTVQVVTVLLPAVWAAVVVLAL